METLQLIKKLQKLVDDWAEQGLLEVCGPHETVIDCWEKTGPDTWQYKGFSGNIAIQRSGDGVYDILCAKESWD